MMRNEAMFASKDDFNEFTDAVKTKCQSDGKKCHVQLRDGQWRDVVYKNDPADPLDTDTWCFRTEDWGFWWYNDGSSPTSPDLDMVGIDR